MFESRTQKLLSRAKFLRRVSLSLALASAVLVFGLSVGVSGYHFIAGFNWTDAFLEASMIMTGMGPVGVLATQAAKIFAAFYALFCGLVFLSVFTIAIAPILHRLLHKFNCDEADFNEPG
jgi:hypothetical protein